MLKPSFACCAILALAGCATAPKSQVETLDIEAPAAFKTAGSGGSYSEQRWLADFNDPILAGLIRESLEHNYNLQAAAARLENARGIAQQAGIEAWPSFTASGNISRNKRNNAGGVSITETRNDNIGVTLRMTWELDLWGRVRAGRRADIADWQAAQEDFRAAQLSLAARTAKLWFQAVEADLQFNLAERSLLAYESNLKGIEDMYKRGIARTLELRLLRANVATARSTSEQRSRVRDAAVRSLEALLGRYPANELALASELPGLSGGVPAGLPSELLLRRPDLSAAERRLASAVMRGKSTRRAILPALAINGSLGTSANESGDALNFGGYTEVVDGKTLIRDFLVWNLGASLTQPLFPIERITAGLTRARANKNLALSNFAAAALTAYQDVENSLSEQDSFTRDYEAQKIAAEESIAAEELAWDEYNRGLTDINTALDAERRSLAAQRSYLQVSNQRLQSRIDLYIALGGGFELAGAAQPSPAR